jgi:hypothetical protein
MEESQVFTVEQNRDGMNNFYQETPFRKPRPRLCGERKCKPDDFELRIMKALEEGNQPNRHLTFFKGIVPSLHNFKEEETLEFQIGVLQLTENIKHRNPSNFSSQSLLVYNQPFHTSSHVGGNNPLLVYGSTMDANHSNMTKPSRWLTPEWCRALRYKNRQCIIQLFHLQRQNNMANIPNDKQAHLPPRTVIIQYTL